jgi:polyhydroxyalkanoate synthesis regulator phasin
LQNLRDALSRGVAGYLNLVVLTRDRLQEAMDEAVERGRITRSDAEEMVQDLVARGRKQAEDLSGNVESLVGQGRGSIESAAGGARKRARQSEPVDRVVRVADRARRTAGIGPSFPILGYDELTAAQVNSRLGDLSPAQMRKVRDYERRHANRKSVLVAIERALG